MKSQTQIITTDSQRLVQRLCNHWKHKFDITEQDGFFTIPFPDATVILTPTSEAIDININTVSEEKITQYEHVVLDHLNRMAQQEFSPTWTHS